MLLCGGCGGGAQSPVQSPSPIADFSMALSSGSLSVAQQGVSSPITLSITGQNGFSGTVQVTLDGLPSGVITNPPSPFSVATGANTAIIFGAAANAATGNFTVSAQGVSGALSHSASLALTVQAATGPSLPRTTYVRTDSLASLDNPAGESRHRRIVYDPENKHVFAVNRAMNRVEVFSSADQSRLAQISVAGASSADLSADGASVWIGTVTEQAVAIDTASLHVRSRSTIPALSPLPNTVFDRPEELLTLASGKIAIRLRQSGSPQAVLAIWDPVANTTADLTSTAPQLFQNGLGVMTRAGDHTKLFVAANDSSGEVAIFDANGAIAVGPRALGAGAIPLVAANSDASRFAAEFVANGARQIILLDSALNQAAAVSATSVEGLNFSRNGNFLYAAEISTGQPVIAVFDGATLQSVGVVPDLAIDGMSTQIEEAEETQLLFGIANRGLSFVDATSPGALAGAAPSFATAPVAQPSEGPSAGGTSTSIAGQNFPPAAQVKFGQQLATSVSVPGATEIQATSPPSVINGAVNLTAYFTSGWLAVAPDAFSYGPQILKILPNAGSKSGGDVVQVYGYGFGADATKITVKIGGKTAAIQSVESVASIAPSLGLDATFPFPIERITLQTPPGTPGKANIDLIAPAGSATATNGFQYLQSVQVYGKAGSYKFLLYDQKRQWIFLTTTDHVDVFDLNSAMFHAAGLSPPGGPPQNAGLRGISLTPDGTQLVVADFGAQNIYLLNPDTGTGTTVATGGVAGFANSGPARVAATSTQTVFVGMSGEGSSSGACASCLSQLNLSASPPTIQPAPQPEVTALMGAPLLQGNAAGDHVFLAYESSPGGPVGSWTAASPNQFTVSLANESAIDLAGAPDGTGFVTRTSATAEIRTADLTLVGTPAMAELEQIPSRVLVPGMAMHPSGALIYQPFLTGPAPPVAPAVGIQGGVDIIDAHSGLLRLRIFLLEPLAMLSTDIDGLHGSFLAIDENGQRIFALTSSGLTVAQLANVPLAIGTIAPSSGLAVGGTTLTIRGSGFHSGTTVTIGGKAASMTFIDMNTLSVVTPAVPAGPQQVVVTNPDGESVALDAAFSGL